MYMTVVPAIKLIKVYGKSNIKNTSYDKTIDILIET